MLFASITISATGKAANSSNFQAINTTNNIDIHDVAKKYTTTFALINCGTLKGRPFMWSGASNAVNHE